MDKTVCILTLGNQSDAQAHAMLKNAASRIGNPSVIRANSAEDFANAVVAERADVVFAAAETSQFLKAKFLLIKKLSLGALRSSSLIAAMGSNAPVNEREKELHAAVPQGARAFYTLDGLYSAFTLKKTDGSVIVFLPLDKERLNQLFATGLGIFKRKEEKEKTAEIGFKSDVKSFISSGKTAAIATCGFSKALSLILSKFENSQFAFLNLPEDKAKSELPFAESVREAAEITGADFGIGISDIMTEPEANSAYIEVCVADMERAEIAKVFSQDGENLQSHVGAALTKLFSMMNSTAQNGGISKPEQAYTPAQPKKQKKKSLLPLVLALSGICAATLISVIIAVTD